MSGTIGSDPLSLVLSNEEQRSKRSYQFPREVEPARKRARTDMKVQDYSDYKELLAQNKDEISQLKAKIEGLNSFIIKKDHEIYMHIELNKERDNIANGLLSLCRQQLETIYRISEESDKKDFIIAEQASKIAEKDITIAKQGCVIAYFDKIIKERDPSPRLECHSSSPASSTQEVPLQQQRH